MARGRIVMNDADELTAVARLRITSGTSLTSPTLSTGLPTGSPPTLADHRLVQGGPGGTAETRATSLGHCRSGSGRSGAGWQSGQSRAPAMAAAGALIVA